MGKSKRVARREARLAAQRRNGIFRTIGLFVVVVGASTAFILTRPPKQDPSAAQRVPAEMSRGPEDAKVTIVEYGDFNCPACKAYHEFGIIDQVLAQYPNDVRFVFRHFPIITQVSSQLAEAAECAYDQEAFWEFHDLLFVNGPSSLGDMRAYANQLGLDAEQFDRCTDSRQHADLVESQLREALQIGFVGTPSFMVNETALAGPPSYAQLVSLIEDALASDS